MSKKVPYQKNTFKKLKMPYHKIPYQKTLSRILKSALSCLKKIPYQKKPHQESKKGALSRNLKTNVKSTLSRIYTKYLKRCLIKGPN